MEPSHEMRGKHTVTVHGAPRGRQAYIRIHRAAVCFIKGDRLRQRFSNFFQVGTTFISQNVLWSTLLLSPLKANLSFF
jgi:hypothetical protein